MQSLINFFGLRRFNYIDVFGLFLCVGLLEAQSYVLAIVSLIVVMIFSIAVERRTEVKRG
jgi:hypothetical protein